MFFTPVSLIGPDGSSWVARDAVELNDLMARGFQRVEVMETVRPVRRFNTTDVSAQTSPISVWNTESPAADDDES